MPVQCNRRVPKCSLDSLAGGGALGTGYGFNGGFDFRIFPRLFVVADVKQFHDRSVSSSNTVSDTAFLFGPRYAVPVYPSARTSVFGQFLVGGDAFHNGGQAYTFTYNSATTFALGAEGGLQYAWSRRLGTRFVGGYLHGRLDNSTYGGPPNPSSNLNNRGTFAADLVYRF